MSTIMEIIMSDKKDKYKMISQEDANQVSNIQESHSELLNELKEVKEEMRNISAKVDATLELLNTFTIMLMQDDEDAEEEEEEFGYEDSWLPKEDDFWENDEE